MDAVAAVESSGVGRGTTAEGYGFVYWSSKLEPAINKGDTIWVDPARPPDVGREVVFESADTPTKLAVAILVREMATHWIVSQGYTRVDGEYKLNPEFRIAKAEWPTAKRVSDIQRG